MKDSRGLDPPPVIDGLATTVSVVVFERLRVNDGSHPRPSRSVNPCVVRSGTSETPETTVPVSCYIVSYTSTVWTVVSPIVSTTLGEILLVAYDGVSSPTQMPSPVVPKVITTCAVNTT